MHTNIIQEWLLPQTIIILDKVFKVMPNKLLQLGQYQIKARIVLFPKTIPLKLLKRFHITNNNFSKNINLKWDRQIWNKKLQQLQ